MWKRVFSSAHRIAVRRPCTTRAKVATIIGIGAIAYTHFHLPVAYTENSEKKQNKDKSVVKVSDIKDKESKVELVSDKGSAHIVPQSHHHKAKIVHVLSPEERHEMEEREKAEKRAQAVTLEQSMHDNENITYPSLSSQNDYPVEVHPIVFPPNVPPPITRSYPARILVNMNTFVKELPIDAGHTYDCWTFNGSVPGPFIRARKGDILEVQFKNEDTTGMFHNIDFHAVMGPGGGAPLLTAEQGQTKRACFRLLYPGLFIYHCAVDPIAVHVTNGMYGAILVEPEEGLPNVDKEFSIVQSEFYAVDPEDAPKDNKKLELSYSDVQTATPSHVVFNGRDGAMIESPLVAHTDSRVRLYFANAGPNLVSSFHVIGSIFDTLYREGDLITAPAHGVQSTLVPAGGAAVVEMKMMVPGTYTVVDHSLYRVEKGAVGYINVVGAQRPDIYHSEEEPRNCPDCKLHP